MMLMMNPPDGQAVPSTDARVARTRLRLTRALIDLTLERGYEAVTIRDLSERAGTGYATFFRHYPDKEALLRDLLEGVLAELMALLEPISADDDAARTGTLVFLHAQRNADLYRVLLASQRSFDLLGRALEVGVEAFQRSFTAREGSEIPMEVAAHHIVRSFVALIEWWLERDMPHPPERMGRIYRDLIMEPTRAAALVPRVGDDAP